MGKIQLFPQMVLEQLGKLWSLPDTRHANEFTTDHSPEDGAENTKLSEERESMVHGLGVSRTRFLGENKRSLR